MEEGGGGRRVPIDIAVRILDGLGSDSRSSDPA
jgi:hypothetical protein